MVDCHMFFQAFISGFSNIGTLIISQGFGGTLRHSIAKCSSPCIFNLLIVSTGEHAVLIAKGEKFRVTRA